MKTIKQTTRFLFLLFSILIISCNSNDDVIITEEGDDPQTILEEERDVTTEVLSNGETKTWKIENAILTNEFGSFDISENFNVIDDEFIFKADGTFIWRPGNDINSEGESAVETLLDYYRSPVNSTFIYNEDSSVDLTALDGNFSFKLEEDGMITGILSLEGRIQEGGELNLILNNKAPEDYPNVPNSGLDFTELVTLSFENTYISNEASSGLIGSYSDNSMFISVTFNDNENVRFERIIKYSPDTNTIQQHDFSQQQFITKKAHIINNELIVIGGQYINTYDNLNANSDPISSVEHGLGITRFPTTVINDNIYIVGGDTENPPLQGNKVRVFNKNTNTVDIVGTLPGPKIYSGTEIVNDKLYVFSGRQYFTQETAETTSYIYDLNTGNSTTFDIPQALFTCYASKNQNLIYIAGESRDANGNRGIYFGTYNTQDDTFTEITHNLDDSDEFSSIHQMTVFNNKIYVLYGIDGNTDFSIMEASIN